MNNSWFSSKITNKAILVSESHNFLSPSQILIYYSNMFSYVLVALFGPNKVITKYTSDNEICPLCGICGSMRYKLLKIEHLNRLSELLCHFFMVYKRFKGEHPVSRVTLQHFCIWYIPEMEEKGGLTVEKKKSKYRTVFCLSNLRCRTIHL